MKRDFLEEMRGGADMRYPVKLKNKTFMLRPLTVAEKMTIMNIVVAEINAKPPEERTAFHEHVILARETLRLASKEDYDSQAPGSIHDYLLDRFWENELIYLYKEYCRITDIVNPMLENLSVDEIKAMIEAVKKKDLELIELSSLQLANLVRYLMQIESPQDK